MSTVTEHYAALFAEVAERIGRISDETYTGIIGFSGGGPVSISAVGSCAFITCELSLYEEQVPSSEGLRYELLSSCGLDRDRTQTLLTALGGLSMSSELGDMHTVDVSGVLGDVPFECIELR